jgi:hypothetical protein
MPTQIGARLVFENAKKFAAEQGYNVSQAVCTQSFVRSEVAMSTTQANYRIPVLANDTTATTFNTEFRLALQDVMVINEIGIFLAAPSSATDAAFLLYSNANAAVFSTSAGPASTLWNSFFNVTVNNQTVIPNWDVYRHYYVPFAQNGVLPFTGATVLPRDSQDGSASGFYPTEPNFILNGAANIQAFITLPAAMSSVVSNSRIVVIWRGIKLQNVTSVR